MKGDKTIFEFGVLWAGWESDSCGWVKERPDGSRYLVMTSHGSEYRADKSDLLDKIKEYENTIKQSRKALKLLAE